MNYIKQLQADKLALQTRIEKMGAAIVDFKGHLHSSKFAGVESDGTRKDWIATTDVLASLQGISQAGNE
jgi:hypothetical protein